MRRTRYRSPFATRKPKKIRTRIRVRERVAKTTVKGKCTACKGHFKVGDKMTVEIIKQRKFHTDTCVPADIGRMPGGNTIQVSATPEAVVKALTTNWSLGEAKMVGMLALENALVVVAKTGKITPELEKSFERYNKFKAMGVHIPTLGQTGTTEAEKGQAVRLAIIELVKAIF